MNFKLQENCFDSSQRIMLLLENLGKSSIWVALVLTFRDVSQLDRDEATKESVNGNAPWLIILVFQL